MAITITLEPTPVMFLLNKQMIYGNSDLPLYEGGEKAYVQFYFIGQGLNPDATIGIQIPSTGQTFLYTAKASPSAPNEIQSWTGFSGNLDQYIGYAIIPMLLSITFISNNYDISVIPLGANRYVKITAKEKGAAFTLTNSTAGTAFVITANWMSHVVTSQAGADLTFNANFYISCDVYKRTFLSDQQEAWTLIAEMREYPDANGNFQFEIGDTCLKTLNPSLQIEQCPDNSKLPDGLPAKFRFNIYENDPDLEENPVAVIKYAVGILGGLPETVNGIREFDAYWKSDQQRKLLTNCPRTITVPTDFAFMVSCFFLNWAPQLVAPNPILYIQPYGKTGNQLDPITAPADFLTAPIFGIDTPDALSVWGLLKMVEQDLHNLLEFPAILELTLRNLDGTAGVPSTISEKITLQIDGRRHDQVNYFIFQNALGKTEICWTYGNLEASTQGEGEVIQRNHHTSQAMYESFPSSGAQKYNKNELITSSFTCNTGLKSLEEIQWMMEMIYSPVVYWMTREGLKRWKSDNELFPAERTNRQYFQPILIKKDSLRYFNSTNGFEDVQFGFTLATATPIPQSHKFNR
jgi:hypothetical protein